VRLRVFIVILFVAVSPHLGHARVFFAGSNPSMTVFAFPQDLWLMPKDYAFCQTTWQVQPWWGDVDQPDLRPSPTYLLTGEKIGVKGSGTYFEHNANLYNWRNIAGLCRQWSPTLKLRFDLDYTFMPMRVEAQGEDGGLSFKYKEGHSIQDLYFTSYAATLWKSIPLGFKFGFGRQASSEPDLDWSINNNGAVSQAQRLMWAWSTLQGSNVLGVEHGDARPQDDYTAGSQYHFDLQGATTLPGHKIGARLRYSTGKLDLFEWHGNGGWDPGNQANLVGSYTNDMAKAISERTGRVYGNFTWAEGPGWKFNTLALSRYTMNDSDYVSAKNSSILEGRKDHARTFVFQVNPNVNLYPWKFKNTFVDLAVLCNYSYTGFSHRQPYWVDGGGQKESFVGTTVQPGEDYVWDDYSYAHSQFFEVAFDANPCFPIYGDARQSVAANLSLLLWTRFKFTNKYYGQRVAPNSDVVFRVNNVRRNYDHEVWLNSVVVLVYRRDVTMYKFTVGQPLIYSLRPETRVYDASGKTMVSEMVHENMWVSQAGMSLGFFISTPINNVPYLKRTSLAEPYDTRRQP
jgi:hypothetical protein